MKPTMLCYVNITKKEGLSVKKAISIFLILMTLLGCLSLSGCGPSKQSAKEKYGMDYYTRSDGKRIWYYTD